MKIIFDSDKELAEFINDHCPSDLNLPEDVRCGYTPGGRCNQCWEQSGFKYEIKNNQSVQKETTLNLNDIIRVKFTDYGKDIYYHRHDDLIDRGVHLKRNYPTIDDDGYSAMQLHHFMNVFGPHLKIGIGNLIIKDNDIYISNHNQKESVQMLTYTDWVYELIKEECEGMDAIYEDYILKLVGYHGLTALKQAGLLESCGVINCRRLYVLCKK